MEIRPASSDDYINIRDFYYLLTDESEKSEFKSGWKRDIYPTQEYLLAFIKNDELYICEDSGQIASAMILNHEYNEGYDNISWSINAKPSEIYVVHALGVHPNRQNCGIAKLMIQKAIDLAFENHAKTIRLDVLSGNIPAERAYAKMGFKYAATIPMYYEDTGWTDFKLLEYLKP